MIVSIILEKGGADMAQLAPVIHVDEDRCVNCHACITACPVKYCIDGTGDTVKIRHDLCIGCGSCIDACTHDARSIIDDYETCMEALDRGERMVAVVAPAVAAHLPEDYLRLNGYLASRGVEAFFDVSFGAELTVKSYLEYVESEHPEMVIAQPCPAIVNYIEIYRPELLRYLAPADSPMVHAMKMIREFFPDYRNHSFVVLSPCVAKRREFDEVGLGRYNVTFWSILRRMEERHESVSSYPKTPFTNPLPERAVLFSSPGGLKETVLREHPELAERIRKIEGPGTIYEYLDKLRVIVEQGMQPLLVDCLNCELGCNGGPGTLNRDKSPDEIEHHVRKRRDEMQAEYRKHRLGPPNYRRAVGRTLADFWNPTLYRREYDNRSSTFELEEPSDSTLDEIYRSMRKYGEEDLYNCSSCGYGSCRAMAVAIHNGLNKPENCHHYTRAVLEREHEAYSQVSEELHGQIMRSNELTARIDEAITSLTERSHDLRTSLEESSASIEQMIASISSAAKITNDRSQSVDRLISDAASGREDLGETVRRIESITGSVKSIGSMIEVIDDVAAHTNLLAINAAIEAAHAGETGRGFSVVADEIRKLAEQTAGNAANISGSLEEMIRDIVDVTDRSQQTGDTVATIITNIEEMAESLSQLSDTMGELSVGSGQITKALAQLNGLSAEIQEAYRNIGESIGSMRSVTREMAEISDRHVESLSTPQVE